LALSVEGGEAVGEVSRDGVRRRDICSQLQVISDEAYAAGIQRLKKDVADAGQSATRQDHLCLITIRGDRP
jgi:hypothetical protein